MAKNYLLHFGTGNPNNYTGLTPTFTVFTELPGFSLIIGITIVEIPPSTGLYTFQFEPTFPIAFTVDGGPSLVSADRYIVGILDPIQAVDEKVGTTADSFGSSGIDPSTVFGYVKRLVEFNEGNAFFDKTAGTWTILSRGSSTVLTLKTLVNNSGSVSKS